MFEMWIDYECPCHVVITEIDAWISARQMLERVWMEALERIKKSEQPMEIIYHSHFNPDLG